MNFRTNLLTGSQRQSFTDSKLKSDRNMDITTSPTEATSEMEVSSVKH